MKKRVIIPLWSVLAALAVSFFSLAGWLTHSVSPAEGLSHYARRLERAAAARERQAVAWFSRRAMVDTLAGDGGACCPEGLALAWYQDGRLVRWTDPALPLPSRPGALRSRRRVWLPDGLYGVAGGPAEQRPVFLLFPIYRTYPAATGDLKPHFPLLPGMPEGITLSEEAPGEALRDPGGAVWGYLRPHRPVYSPLRRAAALLLCGLGLAALMLGAERLARQAPPLAAAGLLAGAGLLGGAPAGWALAPVLPLIATPGGLAMGMLWFTVVWVHWAGAHLARLPLPAARRELFAAGGYGLTLLAVIAFAAFIREVMRNTSLHFDFDNLFTLSPSAFAILAAILALLLPLYRGAQRTVKFIHMQNLPPARRLLTAAAATLLMWPAAAGLLSDLPPAPTLLTAFLYLILLDLYTDYRRQSVTWLIIWLVFFSALSTVLFFKYHLDRELADMLAEARDMAGAPDPEVEADLRQLYRLLETDSALQQQAAVPFPFRVAAGELLPHIERYWARIDRLALHYQYRLSLYNRDYASSLLEGEDWAAVERRLAVPGSGFEFAPGLFRLAADRYWLQLPVPIPGNETICHELALLLEPRRRPGGSVAGHLFPPPDQARQGGSGSESLAVWAGGQPVLRRGEPALDWLRQTAAPPPGNWRRRLNSQRADLLYHAPDGTIVLTGRQLGGYARPLALFSFVFALVLLMAVLVAVGRWLLRRRHERPGPSLRLRLQLAVLALIGGAFVLIGILTFDSFRRSAVRAHREQLFEKVAAVRQALLSGEGERTPADRLAARLATIHQVDVALYGSDGQLAAGSDPYLYRLGILPARVVSGLLRPGSDGGDALPFYTGQIGRLRYRYAFAPTGAGYPGVAFVGVSTAAREGVLNRDLYAFIGTLINVYVFLLLAASVIAIAVANSIARPLDHIGEKLQGLQLGRNEPLEWRSDDEIGQLVDAYNAMIAKLEESTARLRQSEREGAWREMAKQVAHEIKNPLTPMKLSIQHLERAYQADPDRAAELIRRVSRTLVEQIDGLSRIASEFSTFAKMPRPENQFFSLNELVASAFYLFEQNPGRGASLSLDLPAHVIRVYADRGQLLRVLNNLIKNALQALPEDGAGEIQLALRQRDAWAVIRVRDNGTGIPESVIDRVFSPNFTTKNSGMGLGLAMCKSIVDQMGGKIFFETETGKGTDFYVEIPIATEGEAGQGE